MVKLNGIEVPTQALLDSFIDEKTVMLDSPYNILSPEPFSPTKYGQSVNYLHALNVVRKVDLDPNEAQLTVNNLRFGVKLKGIKPHESTKYFSHLKDGCLVDGGFEDSSWTTMYILDKQVEVGYFPNKDTLDIENSKSVETKPIKLDMRDMEIVMQSFNRLLKENETALTPSTVDVDFDIAFYASDIPLGKILLKMGGTENCEPKTKLVPTGVS